MLLATERRNGPATSQPIAPHIYLTIVLLMLRRTVHHLALLAFRRRLLNAPEREHRDRDTSDDKCPHKRTPCHPGERDYNDPQPENRIDPLLPHRCIELG